MNEGMPMKRDIFEKGRLIIKFKVKFPENDFLPPSKLSELDKLLPPRKEIIIPDDAEEHDLVEFNPHERRRHQYKHAQDEDEDGMGPQKMHDTCSLKKTEWK
jgi:DnaJ family protein A protein 1